MVYTRTDPTDGRPRYLRRSGNLILVTKDRAKDCLDDVPEGYEVIELRGHLKARKKLN